MLVSWLSHLRRHNHVLWNVGMDYTRSIDFGLSLTNFKGLVKAHTNGTVLINTYGLRDIWHKSLVVGAGGINRAHAKIWNNLTIFPSVHFVLNMVLERMAWYLPLRPFVALNYRIINKWQHVVFTVELYRVTVVNHSLEGSLLCCNYLRALRRHDFWSFYGRILGLEMVVLFVYRGQVTWRLYSSVELMDITNFWRLLIVVTKNYVLFQLRT